MKDPYWKTAISKLEKNQILIRGYPIEELMSSCSFGEVVYLALKGELPKGNEGILVEAILVSCIDHGLHAPSVNATRFVASCGVPLQSAVASGVNAIGEIHGGAIEAAARLFQDSLKSNSIDLDQLAPKLLLQYRENKKRLPGFGHPIHTEDPRAVRLLQLAEQHKYHRRHCALAEAIRVASGDYFRKPLTLNIDGAMAAVISDLEIPWQYGKGFFIISRSVGLIVHAVEEMTQFPPFRKVPLEDVHYVGTSRRKVPKSKKDVSKNRLG